MGRERRMSAGARGDEAAGLGRESAQQGGGRVFLFFFLFSNSYFPFCIFFLLNKLFCGYSRCWKIESK
jgi:hypothetical protein